MATDPSGIFTLPSQTWVQSGDKVLPEQHNPPMLELEQGMTDRLMRDGRAPMTGDLPMGGNKITGLSDPAAAQDGATKAYVDGEVTGLSNSLGSAADVNHGTDPGEVPLNSDLGSMAVEDAADYVTKASKATQGQAEGGVTGDVWMDDIRVRQALEYKSLGWGQTWVDVTGSRAGNTSYQNTTGKPIMVNVRRGPIGSMEVSPNNSSWVSVGPTSDQTGDRRQVTFVVPPGHYYRHAAASSLGSGLWAELR